MRENARFEEKTGQNNLKKEESGGETRHETPEDENDKNGLRARFVSAGRRFFFPVQNASFHHITGLDGEFRRKEVFGRRIVLR